MSVQFGLQLLLTGILGILIPTLISNGLRISPEVEILLAMSTWVFLGVATIGALIAIWSI